MGSFSMIEAANPTRERHGSLGRVLVSHGQGCLVEVLPATLVYCRHQRRVGRVVCNDRVEVAVEAEGLGALQTLLPRTNLIERADFRGKPKPLAANLGHFLIVIAAQPEPDVHLLDAYLALAFHLGITPLIVINKVDLGVPTEALLGVYRELGVGVLHTSTLSGAGIAPLRKRLDTATGILLGQSGVGKSSLVNAVLPDREARTQTLSAASGQGRHTTSETTLYRLGEHGGLIDSPGVRILRLDHLSVSDIEAGFPEICMHFGNCRFRDCSHREEPGCALLAALDAGQVRRSRLISLQRLTADRTTRR
jgi:ribosome biogenesis GTPase / thiamine phosphate phosphatase